MYLKEKLVRWWFMDRRPGMLSKICGPEICVFVAPMFRSKKEKIPDRYSQSKSKNDWIINVHEINEILFMKHETCNFTRFSLFFKELRNDLGVTNSWA